jgi:hypothetical protein
MSLNRSAVVFFFTIVVISALSIVFFGGVANNNTTSVVTDAVCSEPIQKIKLIIGIMSVSTAKAQRMWLRNTWLRYPNVGKTKPIEPYFVIGNPVSHETEIEAKEFGDILFLNIKENMNKGKTYHWFKYAAENFAGADYVAKVDMDSYIRTVYLESELKCCMPRKKLMWGITMNVPKHFARKYVGGMAEILSMDLAMVLAESPQIEKDLDGPEDLMLGKWFADLDYPMGVMHDSRFHDLPKRGGNAREVTNTSICMHQLENQQDYDTLFARFPHG